MNKKNKEYICIIDDEYQVIKALVRELSDFVKENNIVLKTYTSANDCMQELPLIGKDISVIISDLRMPEIKGSDFFLSVSENFPDIQLILLTAYHDIPDIQKAITAKIGALVIKPWDPDLLLREIEKGRRLYSLIKDNSKYMGMIENQLEAAGDFQKGLMSTSLPDIRNARIEHTYIPYPKLKVGGDYYDIIKLSDSKFVVNMGDVVGHGVRPAFVTAMLKVLSLSVNRKNIKEVFSPKKLLTLLNSEICKLMKNSKDILVTFTSLMIDTEKMEMTIANAGHMPVSIVNKDRCTTYPIPSPAMGFSTDIVYEEKVVPLNKGDIVTLYTDGLLESEIDHTKIREEVIERFFIQASKRSNFNESVIKDSKLVRDITDFHDDVALISIHV
ncbi:MAG: SpoIIE family protein phosphatase [Spirochaetales bacterium]|nr:SpoIIE family protein phosphatase [Spirochaetales bacterium]